jgi:hypothetical protein
MKTVALVLCFIAFADSQEEFSKSLVQSSIGKLLKDENLKGTVCGRQLKLFSDNLLAGDSEWAQDSELNCRFVSVDS